MRSVQPSCGRGHNFSWPAAGVNIFKENSNIFWKFGNQAQTGAPRGKSFQVTFALVMQCKLFYDIAELRQCLGRIAYLLRDFHWRCAIVFLHGWVSNENTIVSALKLMCRPLFIRSGINQCFVCNFKTCGLLDQNFLWVVNCKYGNKWKGLLHRMRNKKKIELGHARCPDSRN